MSKAIKLSIDQVDKLTEMIKAKLRGANLFNGRLDFNYSVENEEKKTTKVVFSPKAYIKMQMLIQNFDTEVAWHGTVERLEDGFLIKDILVYPQEVSGATVNTEQWEYEKWLMGLDDEDFNALRMQGHSHVNMSTSPSGVDTSHQEMIVDKLKGEDFYIFMIWNKKNQHTIRVFDLKENALYESDEVSVYVQEDNEDYGSFLEHALEVVKSKSYTLTKNNYNTNKYSAWFSNKEEDYEDDSFYDWEAFNGFN